MSSWYMCAVDSGMVAMAMGMMAATAAQEALGKVKAGRAKMEPSPSFQLEAASASAGISRKRSKPSPPMSTSSPAAAQPTAAPSKSGIWPRKPFR